MNRIYEAGEDIKPGLVEIREDGKVYNFISPGTVMNIPWYWKIINWFQNKKYEEKQ